MPADRTAVVVLLAPALDTVPFGPTDTRAPEPYGLAATGSRYAASTVAVGVGGVSDPLAEAAAGSFTRSAIEPWPWEARLMHRLGLLASGADLQSVSGALPVAGLLGPDDLAVAPSEGDALVIADPVSLSPGRDEATLTPSESLGLTAAEGNALLAAANGLLAEDGITLSRGVSGRWYLRGLDAEGLGTPPAHFLARREVGHHLPASSAAAPWRCLMTELQMLWHAHPVNEARLERGAPPVNGLWFWGGASPPDVPSTAPRTTVVADEPFARSLARHVGAGFSDHRPFDEALAAAGSGEHADTGDTLLVLELDPYAAWLANDADALEVARERALERWLAPAARAVVDGRAASLVVIGGDRHEARFSAPFLRSRLARLFGPRAARLFGGSR